MRPSVSTRILSTARRCDARVCRSASTRQSLLRSGPCRSPRRLSARSTRMSRCFSSAWLGSKRRRRSLVRRAVAMAALPSALQQLLCSVQCVVLPGLRAGMLRQCTHGAKRGHTVAPSSHGRCPHVQLWRMCSRRKATRWFRHTQPRQQPCHVCRQAVCVIEV